MIRLFHCLLVFVVLTLPVSSHSAATEEYIVGEGDVLNINVYENPDLSTKVRVSAGSTIRVPLLGEVSLEGLTVSQVSVKIESLLADGYLVNPQVDVFIEEYRSKNAIILGEVYRPGQYELRGSISFLEFISKAGGLKPEAGNIATIKRESEQDTDIITIDLEALIKKGDTAQNIPVRGGDTIYISKAPLYYVSGEVKKPDSYKYESGLTVIKAITKAGGFSDIAAKGKVRIIRKISGEEQLLERVAMDETILPDDIIVVPESFF